MNFYELNEKIISGEKNVGPERAAQKALVRRRKRRPGPRSTARFYDRSHLGYSRKKDRFDYQDYADVNEDKSEKDWRVRGSNYDSPGDKDWRIRGIDKELQFSRDQFPTMLNDVLDKKFSAVDKKIFNMITYNNSGRMNDWWLEFKQDPEKWIMKKKED